jgi:hypothetical protein
LSIYMRCACTNALRRPASHAELVRARLIDGIRPVRALLNALVRLPWQATDDHAVLQALRRLRDLYALEQRHLPSDSQIFLGRVWQETLTGPDRERAFCAFEVATLLALRRALRNGTVWIDHSLAFRSRERLFIPADRWAAQRRPYFRRLGLPTDPAVFLEPLVEQKLRTALDRRIGEAQLPELILAVDIRVTRARGTSGSICTSAKWAI